MARNRLGSSENENVQPSGEDGAPHRVRTFLVDDHSLVREAMRSLLSAQPDFEVVGDACNAEEAMASILELRPEIVVLDLLMPGIGGLEAALNVRSQLPKCRIVIASSHIEAEEVQRLLAAGVSGFVSKNSSARELLRALRAAVRGEVALCPEVMTILAGSLREPRVRSSTTVLTLRQIEVLVRLARGLTTREVAADLCLSPKTVEKHRTEILRVLDARNTVVALRKARQLNLIDEN